MKQIVSIKNEKRVLVVEDSLNRIKWFRERLSDDIDVATTNEEAIRLLDVFDYDVIFLDHDAGTVNENGPVDFIPVAEKLRLDIGLPTRTVIIHSLNYQGAMRMQHIMRYGVILPFGSFDVRRF